MEEKHNLSRIIEVFSFNFDKDATFVFNGADFWAFFFAVLTAYVILDAKKFIRLTALAIATIAIALFFKNGDLLMFGGLITLNYTIIHLLLKSAKKVPWIFSLISINAIGIYYFWFKITFDKIYFTVQPIDVWLLIISILLLLSFLKQKYLIRATFLAIVSFFFYFKAAEKLVYLLAASVVINYFLGRWVYVTKSKAGKQWIVGLACVVNLSILGFFKYSYFFADSFNEMFGTDFKPTNMFAEFANWMMGEERFSTKIILPVGVSFFTFQTISYIVDIYRNEIKPVKSFFDYAFFVTFFPPLVAGPIVRARDFIPQIYQPFQLTKKEYSLAVIIIVSGLLKKVVLADFIAVNFIDKIASAPESYPGFVSVLAMWGYSLQIYGDFSGYTDVAIGLSTIMGFRLLQNFDSPYKAISVADFWRRWHKSLGSWLRDYLYIPLGGNRSGGIGTFIATFLILVFLIFITQWYELLYVYAGLMAIYLIVVRFIPAARTNVYRDLNLLITMVVGGIWHGASENFVIWGAMNGVALVIYNYWKKISPYENKTSWPIRFWKILLTFNFITFTRIWFRLEEDGEPAKMLNQIWNHFDFKWDTFVLVLNTYQSVFWVMLAGFIIHWLPGKWKDVYKNLFAKFPIPLQIFAVAAIIFLMYQAMTGESKAFVYFQF